MNMNTVKQGAVVSQMAQVGRARTNAAHDPSRADVDSQIEALSASLKKDLHRIVGLVRAINYDKAALVAVLVANKRATLHNLLLVRNKRLDAEPTPMVQPTVRNRTATKVKAKRFNRWSDK